MANSGSDKAFSETKLLFVVSGAILACTVVLSVWMYLQGMHSLHSQVKAQGIRLYVEGTQVPNTPHGGSPEALKNGGADPERAISSLLKQVEDWALKATVATAACGAALMLAVVLGFAALRRGWGRRMAKTAEEWEQTTQRLKETTAALESQRSRTRGWLH